MVGKTVFADTIVVDQVKLTNIKTPEDGRKYTSGDIFEFSFSISESSLKPIQISYLLNSCTLMNGNLDEGVWTDIYVHWNSEEEKWVSGTRFADTTVVYNSNENRYTVRTQLKDISHDKWKDWGITVQLSDGTVLKSNTALGSEYILNKNCALGKHTITSESEYSVLKAATCTEAGKKAKLCIICGDAINSTIEAIPAGHSPQSYSSTKQYLTCTNDRIVGIKCKNCDEFIPETLQVVEKAKGHQWHYYRSIWRPDKKQIEVWRTCGNPEHLGLWNESRYYNLNYNTLTLAVNQSTDIVKATSTISGDVINNWTSSNDSIATVNKNGKITGKKVGITTIYAGFSDGFTVPVKVYVQKKAVTTSGVSVSTTPVKLKIGETHSLNATVSPITSSQGLTYKTSNKKVAAVSSKGVITAKKAGTATITVISGKEKSKPIKVTVSKPAPTGIKNVASTKTLQKGKSFTIKPKVTPIGAEAKFTYSTSDSKVATVTKAGKVTAKKAGIATIKVKAGSKTVECKVTVTAPAPKSIKNISTKKTLKVGKTLTLKPKFSPTGAEAIITYTSSDETVATVNSSGKITAKKKGTATITVKAGKISKKCKITVK